MSDRLRGLANVFIAFASVMLSLIDSKVANFLRPSANMSFFGLFKVSLCCSFGNCEIAVWANRRDIEAAVKVP